MCPDGSRPAEAPQRDCGSRRPGSAARHPDALLGEAAGRGGRRDGRPGSGDPPGETAAAAESGEVRLIYDFAADLFEASTDVCDGDTEAPPL